MRVDVGLVDVESERRGVADAEDAVHTLTVREHALRAAEPLRIVLDGARLVSSVRPRIHRLRLSRAWLVPPEQIDVTDQRDRIDLEPRERLHDRVVLGALDLPISGRRASQDRVRGELDGGQQHQRQNQRGRDLYENAEPGADHDALIVHGIRVFGGASLNATRAGSANRLWNATRRFAT